MNARKSSLTVPVSILLLCGALMGCDGSDSVPAAGPPTVDPGTPSFLSLSPNLSVYRTRADVPVRVDFEPVLDPATVTDATFYVTEGTEPSDPRVAGVLEVTEHSVTLHPAQPLRFGVRHRVWVGRDVRSTDGERYAWIFPEVTYGNTEVPAPGDEFVVNLPNDLDDMVIDNAYSLMGYIPPLLGLDSEATDPARPEQIPGSSVTEAWKISTGRSDVLVVVIDNGLASLAPVDLVENLYLNRGELPVPRDADGRDACDIAACSDPYDFNGDGRFNIQDYRDAGHAIGLLGALETVEDLNDNDMIDPADLLLAFVDGVDGYPADPDAPEDTGGLVDDVSGYDFLRRQPWALGMPDFPEGVHGGDRAREVAGEADNGEGTPGVCPDCTVMVCRVTYGLIQEAELLSQAYRYAIAKGADVIGSALGAFSATASEVAALEEAAAARVPVVVGMSDESSFHHSTPSMFNHVISTKCNYGFFLESYCTGYGGTTHVSTTGNCGSTACGIITGAAGLLLSRARDLGYCATSRPDDPDCTRPDLSANEVKQILTTTAEKPSDPSTCIGFITLAPCKTDTWDQHQGYGRVNMFRALMRLESDPLPPAVEILTPGWYALLVPGGDTATELTGTIRARVAVGEVECEWAPGIEPEEVDFRGLACDVDRGGALSASLPVAEMAASVGGPAVIPGHPDDKAVTVRVRAYAGGAMGEDRRVFALHRDPDWLEGFPVSLIDRNGDGLADVSERAENAPSIEASPALEDLDGDGLDEIILATSNGQVHALRYRPAAGVVEQVPGYPVRLMRDDGSRDGIGSAPAVGDIDPDGTPDIVVATLAGFLYAFRGVDAAPLGGPGGRLLATDPPPNDSPESYGAGNAFFGSPVLADLNGDGYLDVVAGASDRKVYAVDGRSVALGQAEPLPGWPVRPGDPTCNQLASSVLSTLAVADLNGDGRPEVIAGTSESCSTPQTGAGRLYALWPEGNLHPSGPVVDGFPADIEPNFLGLEIPLPPLTTGIPGSPVAARSGDQVIIGTGTFLGPFAMVKVHRATGDVDVDNMVGLIFGAAGSGAFHRGPNGELGYSVAGVTVGPGGEHGLIQFVHQTPLFLPEVAPFPAAAYPAEDYQFLSNPSFADVDGDGLAELIAVNGGHFVHAFDFQGNEPAGWPHFTFGWHMASPAFGDLDGDGFLDMVAPVREGRIFAWRTGGPVCGAHTWTTFHHDNRRTGNLETPFWEERCP